MSLALEYNQALAKAKLLALEVLLERAKSDDPRESRLAAAQILRAAPFKPADTAPSQAHPESASEAHFHASDPTTTPAYPAPADANPALPTVDAFYAEDAFQVGDATPPITPSFALITSAHRHERPTSLPFPPPCPSATAPALRSSSP